MRQGWTDSSGESFARFTQEEYKALERILEHEKINIKTIHAQALEAEQAARREASWLKRICALESRAAKLEVKEDDGITERRVKQRRTIRHGLGRRECVDRGLAP